MNSKTRAGIMMVIGLYLAYTGYGLIRDTLNTQPDKAWLYILMGVVFILVGIAAAIQKGYLLWKQKIEDMNGNSADTEEASAKEPIAKEQNQRKEEQETLEETAKKEEIEKQIEEQIEEKK